MTSFPPVPAPPMLLDHLLGLVFVVHVIFMNFVLAAPLVITWLLWTGAENKRLYATWLAGVLPVAFTFAINFGVASLLFVQALFSDRFYTANILLGKIWLAVVPLLIAAFYCAYIVKRLITKQNTFWAGLVSLFAGGLTWCVALIMVSNYFATTMADQWTALLANPVLVFKSLTFLPRTLHFIFGAFSVTGIWMVWIAWWKSQRNEDATAISLFRRNGLLLTASATGAQVIVGVWFLIWLPASAWDRLFSGSFPSLIWISGVAAGLALLGVAIVASVYHDRPLWPRIATALIIWTLFGMAAGRDLVRLLAFDPKFHIAQIPNRTQTGAMTVFFSLLIAGLAILLVLIWMIWRHPPTPIETQKKSPLAE
jgi:hypothetical protein